MKNNIFNDIKEQIAPDDDLIQSVLCQAKKKRERSFAFRPILSSCAALAVIIGICAVMTVYFVAPFDISSPIIPTASSSVLDSDTVDSVIPSQQDERKTVIIENLVLSQAMSEAVDSGNCDEYKAKIVLFDVEETYSDYFSHIEYDGKTVAELTEQHYRTKIALENIIGISTYFPKLYQIYADQLTIIETKLSQVRDAQIEYAYQAQAEYLGNMGIEVTYEDGCLYVTLTPEQLEFLDNAEGNYFVSLISENE